MLSGSSLTIRGQALVIPIVAAIIEQPRKGPLHLQRHGMTCKPWPSLPVTSRSTLCVCFKSSDPQGQPAFNHIFGMGLFEYLGQYPEIRQPYNEAMTDLARQRAAAVVAAYDFSSMRKIVDAGGGQGSQLIALLKANPTATGVLFDLPSTLEGARQAVTVENLAGRCELVAGGLFASVPSGADAYLLSGVIHDWADEQAAAILQNCHRVVAANGKLLLIERVTQHRTERSATLQPYAFLADLTMTVIGGMRADGGGIPRTLCPSGLCADASFPDPVALQRDRGSARVAQEKQATITQGQLAVRLLFHTY